VFSCAREVGLQLSPGKNYLHDSFLTINTELYRIKRDNWEFVPYINMALVLGLRSKGEDRDVQLRDLAGRANTLIKGWPEDKQDALMSAFIANHRPLLDRFGSLRSWFLPPHLFGLGLPMTRAFALTRPQKLVASLVLNYPSEKIIRAANTGLGEDELKAAYLRETMKVYKEWEVQTHRRLICDSDADSIDPIEKLSKFVFLSERGSAIPSEDLRVGYSYKWGSSFFHLLRTCDVFGQTMPIGETDEFFINHKGFIEVLDQGFDFVELRVNLVDHDERPVMKLTGGELEELFSRPDPKRVGHLPTELFHL